MTAKRLKILFATMFVLALSLKLTLVWGAETTFEFFEKLSNTAKSNRPTRNQKMKWTGELTEAEKKDFIDYFDTTNREFELFSLSQILKDDLDNDGQAEYVVNLLVEEPQPFYYGEVLCMVRKHKKKLEVVVISGPIHVLKRHRIMRLIDVTGYGLKDIIEHDSWGVHDEIPEQYTGIYKNDRVRFQVVYQRNNYDLLQFEDLDRNGTVEILEKRSEVPFGFYAGTDGWWVNIYNWNGTRFEMTNSKYLSFYIEKAKYYQEVLNRSIKRNEEYKRKTGKNNSMEINQIEAMREYLRRIELMKAGTK